MAKQRRHGGGGGGRRIIFLGEAVMACVISGRVRMYGLDLELREGPVITEG